MARYRMKQWKQAQHQQVSSGACLGEAHSKVTLLFELWEGKRVHFPLWEGQCCHQPTQRDTTLFLRFAPSARGPRQPPQCACAAVPEHEGVTSHMRNLLVSRFMIVHMHAPQRQKGAERASSHDVSHEQQKECQSHTAVAESAVCAGFHAQ